MLYVDFKSTDLPTLTASDSAMSRKYSSGGFIVLKVVLGVALGVASTLLVLKVRNLADL